MKRGRAKKLEAHGKESSLCLGKRTRLLTSSAKGRLVLADCIQQGWVPLFGRGFFPQEYSVLSGSLMEQSLASEAIISQIQSVPKGPQWRLSPEGQAQGLQVFRTVFLKETA